MWLESFRIPLPAIQDRRSLARRAGGMKAGRAPVLGKTGASPRAEEEDGFCFPWSSSEVALTVQLRFPSCNNCTRRAGSEIPPGKGTTAEVMQLLGNTAGRTEINGSSSCKYMFQLLASFSA